MNSAKFLGDACLLIKRDVFFLSAAISGIADVPYFVRIS